MKINEIKQVVKVEYIADDGTIFQNKEMCEAYEMSEMCAVNSKLKRLHVNTLSHYELNREYCGDGRLEIFDIQSQEDFENLKKYLCLKLDELYENKFIVEKSIEDALKNCTVGHEILIFWDYDYDNFYTCGDGSLDGYIGSLASDIKQNFAKITNNHE